MEGQIDANGGIALEGLSILSFWVINPDNDVLGSSML